MARINLLPWREELRKKRQQDFLIAMGAGVVITAILYGLFYLHLENLKEYQTRRNQLISDEIATVEKKIAEIKQIEEKKAEVGRKIELIQDLQASRPQSVHVFDELRKITPNGIYLLKFTQKDQEVTVVGKSKANSIVSDYMNAVEKSEWFADPKLKFVRNQDMNAKEAINDFTMTLKLKDKKPKKDEPGDPAAATPVGAS